MHPLRRSDASGDVMGPREKPGTRKVSHSERSDGRGLGRALPNWL